MNSLSTFAQLSAILLKEIHILTFIGGARACYQDVGTFQNIQHAASRRLWSSFNHFGVL